MRFATVLDGGVPTTVAIRGAGFVAVAAQDEPPEMMRRIASIGDDGVRRLRDWVERQPGRAFRPLGNVLIAPAVVDPGAIYTIGANYTEPREAPSAAPERPLVYGKLPSAVSGTGTTIRWDRALSPSVDPEVELGVVIGEAAFDVAPEHALEHVFGYTCINDISSRDPWLDGDQWLLGKSMAGFCPVGPEIVTRDELDPTDLRLGCRLNGVPVQDGRTSQMRSSVAEVVSYLSRHVELRPGDLIAMGTPPRLPGPPGPERHLEPGDVVTVWIERIGELTTIIA